MMGEFFQNTSWVDFWPWMIFPFSVLWGSVPFGLLFARLIRKDSQEGLQDEPRLNKLGFSSSELVIFIFDVAKGVLPVFLASSLGWHFLSSFVSQSSSGFVFESSLTTMWFAGILVVMGHCFSPWVHFNGGKGVATALGVILVLSPIAALIGFLGYLTIFFARNHGHVNEEVRSLSSIVGSSLAAATYLVVNPMGNHLWVGAALFFFILARNEANIDRLLEDC